MSTIVLNLVAPCNASDVLFGRTRQEILSLAFTRPDESFYLREIVRRTGCGTGAVQRELAQLTGCGILRRDKDRFYRANPDSPLFEPLKQLIVRTAGLANRLRIALDPLSPQIRVAFIFGSFVRGDHHQSSDVDMMIVTKDAKLTLELVCSRLQKEQAALAREINAFVLPARELSAKWRSGSHFIRRVLADEKIFLAGSEDELKRVAEERVAQAPRGKRARNRRSARAGGA